jgi:hypothetical protein
MTALVRRQQRNDQGTEHSPNYAIDILVPFTSSSPSSLPARSATKTPGRSNDTARESAWTRSVRRWERYGFDLKGTTILLPA